MPKVNYSGHELFIFRAIKFMKHFVYRIAMEEELTRIVKIPKINNKEAALKYNTTDGWMIARVFDNHLYLMANTFSHTQEDTIKKLEKNYLKMFEEIKTELGDNYRLCKVDVNLRINHVET